MQVMDDRPLMYREPDTEDPRIQRMRRAQRTMWIGLLVFTISILLTLGPLVWGKMYFNKFIVAFAFLGDCAGLSFILHGGWDWLRGKFG
jgi:hypothetical protein